MKRGKSQLLFRFLPSMVFDSKNCILKIDKWDCQEIIDINKTRVVQQIHKNLRPFIINGNAKGFPSVPDVKEYAILEPKKVEARVWPLTYVCNNNRCNAAFSFETYESNKITQKLKDFTCPRCKIGNLYQFDMIYFDSDGKLDYVKSPKEIRKDDSAILMKNGKNPKNWRWKSSKNPSYELSLNTRNFDAPNQPIMYPRPFRTTAVMYPFSEEFININSKDEKIFHEHSDLAKLKIAEYLDLLDKYKILYEDLSNIKENTNDSTKLNTMVEDLKKKGLSDEIIENIKKSYEISHPSEFETKMKIIDELNSKVDFNSKNYLDIALECFDYLETINLEGSKSISEVVKEAQEEGRSNVYNIKMFPSKLGEIGIKNSYIVKDLSILTTTYGFTRKEIEPDKAVINSFQSTEDEPRIPIYGTKKNTEAIVFELDRMKILFWLKENGINIDLNKIKSDEDAKIWFLNNIQSNKISRFNEIDNTVNIETKMIYSLIHTISHSLLIQASFQSGYEKESLGEIILPSIPSVILYLKTANDFQLGGMHTLFENHIIPWVVEVKELIRRCIYDPVCKSKGGACHACLHISEGSCQHFNKDLGRHYLIGNKKTIGFWTPSFNKKYENK